MFSLGFINHTTGWGKNDIGPWSNNKSQCLHGFESLPVRESSEVPRQVRHHFGHDLVPVNVRGLLGKDPSNGIHRSCFFLAHEINQPLTAILSNAQAAQRFLSQTPPDLGEVRQILDDIVRDNKRAGEVIRRVRALVRKEKPRQESLDLNELIQQVVELVRGDSLLQGLSVATDLSPELVAIYGDGIQLQQVILNLILNGAAAMKNAPLAQRKIVVSTAMVDTLTVMASVTDFGVGIDENNIERLFEPFYTTKSEGLGMGLSISRTIVKAHGGTLGASNNKEGGATFALTLPAHLGDRS